MEELLYRRQWLSLLCLVDLNNIANIVVVDSNI